MHYLRCWGTRFAFLGASDGAEDRLGYAGLHPRLVRDEWPIYPFGPSLCGWGAMANADCLGGGGGGAGEGTSYTGGDGGNGVVIIRYAI